MAIAGAMGSVRAVAAMHEEMHSAAQEQKKQRPCAQEMCTVFEYQKERSDPEKDGERQPRRRAPEIISVVMLTRFSFHFSTPSFARFSNKELPMTESELAVMATTPIIGCRRPSAAIGIAATL